MATSKELRARVRLDTKQAESALNRLTTKINALNKAVRSASNLSKLDLQYDRLAMAQKRLALQEQRLALQRDKFAQQQAMNTQRQAEREQAYVDRILNQELNALHKKQQAKWSAFQKEQAQYEKQLARERQIQQEAQRVNNEWRKTHPLLTKIADKLKVNKNLTSQWGNSMNSLVQSVNSRLKGTNSLFGGIWGFVRQIAGTLLGIGTIKIAIDGADTLTGAQNRLNNVAAKQLGSKAYTYDSSGKNVTGYSQEALNMTQDAMDKIYVAAQNSRSSYDQMMANVSKLMTLSGEAFDGSTDKAIRFQEIMNKAYVVGGATASEMHNSMTQLTQAIGAGVLAGDELRSVREGAPLAYQAIEEFAQGVLKTDESLKDLAADGKITSDMVVEAVMNMGNSVDQAFALTKWRFSEVWESIKNAGKRAFQPVISMMTDALNRAVDDGLVQKCEQAFTNIAKGVMIVFTVIQKTVGWIAENWDWLQHVIIGAIGLMITWTLIKMGISVWAAFIEAQAWLTANGIALISFLKIVGAVAIVLMAIMALVYVVYLWKQGVIDTCTAIGYALLAVAAIAFVIFGWQVALVIALIALVIMFLDVVCGVGWVILTFIGNICQDIGNILAVLIAWAVGVIYTAIAFVINLISGLLNVIGAACDWIGDKWNNFCANMEYQFWNAIANMVEDCEWLINALNKVAEFFGKDTISVEGLRGKADAAKSKITEVGGFGETVGAAWNKGWNTVDWYDWEGATRSASTLFGTGLEDWSVTEAYNQGSSWGSGIMDKVNKWGSKFQKQNDKEKEKSSIMDELGKKLGLEDDFANMGKFPTEGIGSYGPDVEKALNSIDGNTGKMADSMDMSEDDLEYLRKIADTEWKKEFTTAEIKVEMTNNNNVDKDFDLHSLAIGLRDLVEEEMFAVANGVYA